MEPWIAGAAEISVVVNGINPSRDEPVLDIVDLPYLNHDRHEYNPNQVVIYWDRYRWGAVDLIILEHDDGMNYKELATLFLSAANDILKSIPDPKIQSFASVTTITKKLILELPDFWDSNDGDFVDAFYTLQEGQRYMGRYGAGGNAKATFLPLMVNPR